MDYSASNPARNEEFFSIRPTLLTAYRDEFEQAMVRDWDGAGSVALTEDVLVRAEGLIHSFGTTENLVEVTPGRDGSLSFIWEDRRGSYVYLDVGPNDTVHLYTDVIGQPKWEGVSVADDKRILEQLSRAFHTTGWRLRQMVVVSIQASTHNSRGATAQPIPTVLAV
jgi:hypothetical protein